MILLAIDSGESCSAALWDSSRGDSSRASREPLLALRVLDPARGQAERLIGLIEAVLADAGLSYQALGAIAVNHGPGSFTGLRSAVAAARGLALATGLGVIAVSSLEALAAGLGVGRSEVMAALDARRGEVYVQRFGPALAPTGPPRAVAPQEAAASIDGPVRLVGSGAPLIQALLPDDAPVVVETVRVDAGLVVRCAALRLAAGERPVAGFAVRPLYLRAPDARPPAPLVARAVMAAS